jgi:hypothetical protein
VGAFIFTNDTSRWQLTTPLSGFGDYEPGHTLRPPPNPRHLRAGGDKSGSLELGQQRQREPMSFEQGGLGVSGGIAKEKFKSTLSFVHCRCPAVHFLLRLTGIGRWRTSELD